MPETPDPPQGTHIWDVEIHPAFLLILTHFIPFYKILAILLVGSQPQSTHGITAMRSPNCGKEMSHGAE